MAKEMSLKDVLAKENAEELIAKLDFEQGLKLLEELVEKVESGTLPLEKAVASYERGVALVERLRNLLSGAEERLKVLEAGSKKAKG